MSAFTNLTVAGPRLGRLRIGEPVSCIVLEWHASALSARRWLVRLLLLS